MKGKNVKYKKIYMKCKACGYVASGDEKYCLSCGVVLDSLEEVIEPGLASSDAEMAVETLELPKKPIGGWMILVTIGLFGSAFLNTIHFFGSLNYFTDGTMGYYLNSSYNIYYPSIYYWSLAALLSSCVVVVLAIRSLVFLFQRKRAFRFATLLLYLFNVVSFLIFEIWVLTMSHDVLVDVIDQLKYETGRGLVQGLIVLGIWGAYLYNSKRVEETFDR